MNLNLTREALRLLNEAVASPFEEFTRHIAGKTVMFEANGYTLNDPISSRSIADWQHGAQQLLDNEFIEELANGIFKVTSAGIEYANSHLK